jgi:RNA polymerase-binding transcription factor DksA
LLEAAVDHPPLEHERLSPGSLEAQCARCEAALVEELCTLLHDIQEALTEDMTNAFARLEAGLYGYCADCHQPIAAARLDASPFSIRCESCERQRGKETPRPMRTLAA